MANNAHQSFYNHIDQRYGTQVTRILKNYASTYQKLACMNSRKDFLVQCRRNGIFPSHITNTFRCTYELLEDRSPYSNKLNNCIKSFKKAILNIEISHTFYKIKSLNQQIEQIKTTITNNTDPEHHRTFLFTQELAYQRVHNRKIEQTNRKFNRLMTRSASNNLSCTPTLNEQAIFNATNKQIPDDVKIALSLSPRFAVPFANIRQIPFYHLLADTENVIKTHIDHRVQDRTRCNITNLVHNYINSFPAHNRQDPDQKFITNACLATTKYLKSNPDVCVLPADKGNRTVVMNIADYNTKMKLLLDDTNTYQVIKTDPTHKFQTENNKIVVRLFNLQLIDASQLVTMRTYTATCPRIYGQPKAHKANLPLRPVVPGMTSPCYELSKYVCKILQLSICSKYNVRDSLSFCRDINTVIIPDDHIMVSFDVVSLFTNIPKDVVLRDIIYSWTEISTNTKICLDIFLEIVDFCMNSSYFVFDKTFYMQTSGTAMGNPLSPVLSDFVMETLIDAVLWKLDFGIHVIRKYVDDLVLILPKDRIGETLRAFNSYHPNIQFTCEEEQEGRLAYLDMTLVRQEDNSIRTEWFIKPIASGRLLNFNSAHPISQKINIIKNFIDRVNKLSTNHNEARKKQIINKYLALNNYPRQLINRCLNTTNWSPNQYTPTPVDQTEPIALPQTYRSLPYIPRLTPKIIQQLRKDYPNIIIIARSTHTISNLYSKIKDPLAPSLQHNVIYRISCHNCECCYIGLTSNLLKTRLYGHQTNINKLEELLRSGVDRTDDQIRALGDKTALIYHCIEHDHRFDLTGTQIIDRSYKYSSLPLLEMFHIYNHNNSVNRRTDIHNLSNIYSTILHKVHEHTNGNNNQQNHNQQVARSDNNHSRD